MEKYKALSRKEVVKVIERKGTSSRVPCNIHFWVHTGTLLNIGMGQTPLQKCSLSYLPVFGFSKREIVFKEKAAAAS